jgi:hypothetical protein
MEKVIIFDTDLNGHHLEYINHLYLEAVRNKSYFYVFIIPEEFINLKSKLNWPNTNNVEFDYLIQEEVESSNKSNLFFGSFIKSKLLKQKIVQHNADKVFLIMLMQFLPFLPFLLINTKVKISGIVYLIYLYRWKKASFLTKTLDVLKYLMLTHFSLFNQIYLLNDKSSVVYLNKIYKTSKFIFLPDPFVINTFNDNIEEVKLDIIENSIVFLHFGALTERKGTLEIMKAIDLLDLSKIKKPLCFIFAGKIMEDIKVEFNRILNETSGVQVFVFDKFCTYEFIGTLCEVSDYILIPYKNVYQSSGVIAYASYFNKPVVAPFEGLLGKLVRKYKLGLTINEIDEITLAELFQKIGNFKGKIDHSYLMDNTIADFQKRVFINNLGVTIYEKKN